jgi:hypothetical protein
MEERVGGLIITGLLALLGTVAGGVVKGYWDTNLAAMDFQSQLILRALEPEEASQRVSSLEFLVKANLISDPAVEAGLREIIASGEESIPQFLAVGASRSLESRGVNTVESARDLALQKHPELRGKNIALVGFRVRHGDIIDAVTPIYSEVSSQMELVGKFEGERIGGTGGGETVLLRPGYVVTGFDIQRGYYFGRDEVVHMQVYWTRLGSRGLVAEDTLASPRLGSGANAHISKQPEEFRAQDNAFISDFAATTSFHTSGETFLNDIEISESMLVLKNP